MRTAAIYSRQLGPHMIDVVLKEGHKSLVSLTDNAIESGAKVTDHAHVEPKEVTIDFADGNQHTTYRNLLKFQEKRTPFNFVTGLYIYFNLMIVELTAERDPKTNYIVKGSVKLRQVVIVKTARTDGDKKGGEGGGKNSTKSSSPDKSTTKGADTKDKATGPTNRGDQPARPVDAPKNQSILKRSFSYQSDGNTAGGLGPGGVGGSGDF